MTLIRNVGKVDKNIRLALGGLLVFGAIVLDVSTTGAVVMSILGLVVLATGSIGTCPAYTLLKIDTTKNDKA